MQHTFVSMKNGKKDLKSFIESQIEKTGFPTELEVMEKIGSKGWDYVPSSLYHDYDEDKWREIDVIAFNCEREVEGQFASYKLCADLVLDCKKSSDHAWVFIVPPKKQEDDWRRLFDIDFFEPIRITKQFSLHSSSIEKGIPQLSRPWLDSALIRKHLPSLIKSKETAKLKDFHELGLIKKEGFQYFTKSRIGLYGKDIKIPKNGKSRTQIFEALLAVNKALSYTEKMDGSGMYFAIESLSDISKSLKPMTIEILIPLIVFDGALYSWEKDEGVIEQKQILARSAYRSDNYEWSRLVPIVHIDQFTVFLDYLNKDLDKIHRSMIRELEKCDVQIKNLATTLIQRIL